MSQPWTVLRQPDLQRYIFLGRKGMFLCFYVKKIVPVGITSLTALTHTTVAQNVGGLLYAVAPGVRHHGGGGTAATAKVGGARFS